MGDSAEYYVRKLDMLLHTYIKQKKNKCKYTFFLYIRNLRPTLNRQRHRLPHFKYTVLTEKRDKRDCL